MKQYDLYFGRDIKGGRYVSFGHWDKFVKEVISERFSGFTVIPCTGHWKGDREDTFIVRILVEDDLYTSSTIAQIRSAYKYEFQQESVMLVVSDVTIDF